jgi:hypothetical protein
MRPAVDRQADLRCSSPRDGQQLGLPLSWDAAWSATGAQARFLTASIAAEIGVLITLSVLFPFMVHLVPVPDHGRLGARLLPMFYAPLLGALLGRARSAYLVAAIAPWANWLITSYPVPPVAGLMTLQLIVFVATVRGLLTRCGARWFLAAPAYLAALAAATIAVVIFPALVGNAPALAWAWNSVALGAPGIAILVAINWLAVRSYPTGPGRGPMTA